MTAKQSDAPTTRRGAITSEILLVVLLAVEVALFSSERFFPKGWAVLIATAFVISTTLYYLYRFTHAFLAHSPFQFGIRSLLLFTVIIAVCCGWMKLNLNQAAMQRKALEPMCPSEGKWPSPLPPPWLRDLLGDNFFLDVSDECIFSYFASDFDVADIEFLKSVHRLTKLHLGKMTIADAGLKRLKEFKELSSLSVYDSQISETALGHLGEIGSLQELYYSNIQTKGDVTKYLIKLKHLRHLILRGTILSDEGLNNIKAMNQLEELSIENSGITDTRLKVLASMGNLRRLNLSKNPITDDGLKHLIKLEQLENLILNETAVTDAGLLHLKSLKTLKYLSLWQTNITDDGLKEFQEYENIIGLDLSYTKITDAGLERLKGLKQLGSLELFDTNATAKTIIELKKALPNTKFSYNYKTEQQD